MTDSILDTTKASLGLAANHTAFDTELIMHINSVLSDMPQLGVGPDNGIEITDATTTWKTLIGTDKRLNSVKSLTHLRVKMLFDPPDVGFVLTAMEKMIEKGEWRLNIAAEEGPLATKFTLTAGRPFSQSIRVKNAKNIWPTLDLLEVRAQMRSGMGESDALIANLHDYMTCAFDENDLVVTLSMTGEQTRELYNRQWGTLRRGYFNIIISDVGTVDSRAIVVPLMTLWATNTTVRTSGAL
jgi:hypothetical protein